MSDISVSERVSRSRGLREEVEAEEPDLEAEALKGDDSLGKGDEAEATVGITETEDDEDDEDDEEMAGQAADDAEDHALVMEALREATAKQWERDVHEFGVRNAEVLQAVRPPLMELGWKVAAFTSKDNDKSRVLTIQLTGRSAFAQLAMPYESGEPVGRFENAPKGKGFQVDGSGVVQVEESADEDEEEEVESIGPAGLGIEAEFDPDDLPDG